jgi:hypothetical protein
VSSATSPFGGNDQRASPAVADVRERQGNERIRNRDEGDDAVL